MTTTWAIDTQGLAKRYGAFSAVRRTDRCSPIKAWRESRSRFLLSAVTLGWFCSLFVAVRPMLLAASARPFAAFVEDSIYAGSIRNLFCLSLPVTRERLAAMRAAVGVAEVSALALVPTAAVLGVGWFQREAYSVADAVRYSTQWAVTGSSWRCARTRSSSTCGRCAACRP